MKHLFHFLLLLQSSAVCERVCVCVRFLFIADVEYYFCHWCWWCCCCLLICRSFDSRNLHRLTYLHFLPYSNFLLILSTALVFFLLFIYFYFLLSFTMYCTVLAFFYFFLLFFSRLLLLVIFLHSFLLSFAAYFHFPRRFLFSRRWVLSLPPNHAAVYVCF